MRTDGASRDQVQARDANKNSKKKMRGVQEKVCSKNNGENTKGDLLPCSGERSIAKTEKLREQSPQEGTRKCKIEHKDCYEKSQTMCATLLQPLSDTQLQNVVEDISTLPITTATIVQSGLLRAFGKARSTCKEHALRERMKRLIGVWKEALVQNANLGDATKTPRSNT